MCKRIVFITRFTEKLLAAEIEPGKIEANAHLRKITGNNIMIRFRCLGLVPFMLCCTPLSFGAEGNWPAWRGPSGDGHASGTLPVRWDAKAVVWKTVLPGTGQSSPITWGDRIFLTAALDKGKQRVVLCVDRIKGAILWQQVAWTGVPEPSHAMNGWASATCATDGDRVVAFFGKGGLHCYSMDGKPLWSRDLGSFAGAGGLLPVPSLLAIW